MWKGRFQVDTSNLVQRYGESISFDWRLFPYDVEGSIAHATALKAAGIITATDLRAISKGLREIRDEIAAGSFDFDIALEDIHMNIESALTKRIGDAGAKLHTARSRNDQVALDTRLYCRAETEGILDLLLDLQRTLVSLADDQGEAILPGYTHLQRGQPVLYGHHLLAYVEMFDRDIGRLRDAHKRINVMPLGSGALAGSTIPLDRKLVAELLGFPAISQNSMDAVSDRDYIAELLFAFALIGTHLSRLS
ncbi:MAG: argininosuccinate lyase, partial [Myxococcota bacterium]